MISAPIGMEINCLKKDLCAMHPYKDIGGKSRVTAYEIAEYSIAVRFKDGDIYLYSYSETGKSYVEKMKLLATTGQGLATFINHNVGKDYQRKLNEGEKACVI